jgi:predicted Holliday junction resolvase-like endonuclease
MHDTTLLVALLAFTLLALVVLLVRHLALHARLHRRIEAEVAAWRERELDGLRAEFQRAAQTEARGLLARWRAEHEAEIRADAVRRSAAVVAGKVTEHLAPYLTDFPYDPKDVRFLGTPVDLIVFDGLNTGRLERVVFVEIKTGASQLSTRERRVREAIQAGRVGWEELRFEQA